MTVVRLGKIALVAGIAFFFTLVAFNNITDYDSNWEFVRHVLSMDTTFPDSSLHWRAITSETVQTIGYIAIIATQTLVAAVLWWGCLVLLGSLRGDRFNRRKTGAIAGLMLGMLLYIVGFIAIGGEWFAMWQSSVWNGQETSFAFIGMIGLVLVVLLLPDPEVA